MAKALTTKINEERKRIANETKHMHRTFARMDREGYSEKLQRSIDHRSHNINVSRAILVDLLLERVAELEAQVETFGKEFEVG